MSSSMCSKSERRLLRYVTLFITHIFFLKLHLQIHDAAKPVVGLLNGLFKVFLFW